MKVLRIGHIDPAMGGLSSAYMSSVMSLAKHSSCDVRALVVSDANSLAHQDQVRKLEDAGVEVRNCAVSSAPNEYLANGPAARALTHALTGTNLVHVDGLYYLPVALLAAGRAFGRVPPLVLSPHETLTLFDRSKSRNTATRLIKPLWRRAILPKCSSIIFSSDLERHRSLEVSSAISFSIPHVVEAMQIEAPRRAGGNSPVKLGFLGRIHPKKGLERLLASIDSLRREGLAISLRVAGSGNRVYEEQLRRRSQAALLRGSVEWCGWLSGQNDKAEFYRTIDALVMPSDFECFGLSAAEAAVEGVPVIVTNTTGMAEYVKEFSLGYVCEPTVTSLSDAIVTLAASEAVNSRTAEFRNALSAKRHAQSLESAYRKVSTP